jgi:hypothetical protein
MNRSITFPLVGFNRWNFLWTIFFVFSGFAAGFVFPLRLALPVKYEFFPVIIVIFLALWFAWSIPKPWGFYVSSGLTALLFSSSLAVLWRTGDHGIYQVFGVLPWFDAQGYYSEALRLLDGQTFTQISARRPLFPGLFSVILQLTGKNLRISLAIFCLLGATTTWLAAREIIKSFNKPWIPALTTTLLFFFYRNFSGTVLTETLGYPLGLLGFTLLWNAASTRRMIPALAGLFCTTLALIARPGAVLALPLLAFWITFFLMKGSGWVRPAFLSIGTIATGIFLNSLLVSILAPNVSSSFANFSSSVYGIVHGGVGWKAVYTDHPEYFQSGDEGFAASQVYETSWQTFREHPELTMQGITMAYQTFFSVSKYSAFNFLGGDSTPRVITINTALPEVISRWIANILFIFILFAGFIARKNTYYTLLSAINLGILVSIPFAPPMDAENMRAYAATICGMITGIVLIAYYPFTLRQLEQPEKTDSPRVPYILAAILVSATLVGPVLVRYLSQQDIIPTTQCGTGEDRFVTQVTDGTSVTISNYAGEPFVIPYARYLDKLDQFPDANIAEYLKQIPPDTTISQQIDTLQNTRNFWLIGPVELIKRSNTLAVYCGSWGSNRDTDFLFFANRVLP